MQTKHKYLFMHGNRLGSADISSNHGQGHWYIRLVDMTGNTSGKTSSTCLRSDKYSSVAHPDSKMFGTRSGTTQSKSSNRAQHSGLVPPPPATTIYRQILQNQNINCRISFAAAPPSGTMVSVGRAARSREIT